MPLPQVKLAPLKEMRKSSNEMLPPLKEMNRARLEIEECRGCLDPGTKRPCCDEYYCNDCYCKLRSFTKTNVSHLIVGTLVRADKCPSCEVPVAGKKKARRGELSDNTRIVDKGMWATHLGLIVRLCTCAALGLAGLTFFTHFM
jgi:hypothetical protein